jgi:hypothetical protein
LQPELQKQQLNGEGRRWTYTLLVKRQSLIGRKDMSSGLQSSQNAHGHISHLRKKLERSQIRQKREQGAAGARDEMLAWYLKRQLLQS